MERKNIILVTGGNRGIGLEIVRQLAEMGHTVIMGSRNQMKGEKAAKAINGDVIVKKIDVTSLRDIRLVSEFVESEYGFLDTLINNAGILNGAEGIASTDMASVRKVLTTNYLGAWNMIQYFLPLLHNSTDPRIINVSSGMGAWGELTGGYAAYRMSKSSLNALTVLLSNELAGNIKVNAMCPGWVKTEMGGEGASRDVSQGADTAVWLSVSDRIPHGKFLRDRKEIDW